MFKVTSSKHLALKADDLELPFRKKLRCHDKGPKLGFEIVPSEGKETLEKRAAELAEQTRQQAEQETEADKPLDFFKL